MYLNSNVNADRLSTLQVIDDVDSWSSRNDTARALSPRQEDQPTWSQSSSSSSDEESRNNSPNSQHSPRTILPFFNHQDPLLCSSATETQHKGGASVFFLTTLLCGLTAMYTSRTTLSHTLDQVAILQKNRSVMDASLQKAESELQRLRREIVAVDVQMELRQQQQQDTASLNKESTNSGSVQTGPERRRASKALKEMHSLQNRLKMEAQHVDHLKDVVQAIGQTQVLEKYGASPQRVEMELVFPDGKLGPNKFVMELAPVALMPHSVHFFLEMVSLELLDGCSFILNALHVLKAAPLPYTGSSAAEKAKDFTNAGLESVAFKEYSELYPHKQYTVGFAADGSPSFYINTQDNSKIHVGDPCFATIVSGFAAVQRLEACPTRNGIWFEKRIGIKSARIVT
jgi:cyclophilin family peptidyl-prolyl cis-trans isomerase